MIYQGETFSSARTATRDLHDLIELRFLKRLELVKIHDMSYSNLA
ncbi:hypothetical protein J2Y38_004665 [Flavobacterium sp. 2755]|nr:hypothetical protein [Flavobacterium sp. 2755]